ncbi:HTH-type transcriptional activator BauR [Kordiimonas sediminis]|uniref:HTH-type transcriptional activator BauR n=1 Tax=Kordiimonas sediminis TaxID=1735581 RepID=A0A919AKD3_9PROT|nr:LysR family transcriptional regulator [Kordiimonas sediminis]GHF12659.1 HTH-type transcriptional activator BauR [Kordiimonas sediminis]
MNRLPKSFSGQINTVDIRLLRIFSTIVENGGLTQAAAHLGVDSSTISRQLTDLETRLGLRLCERSRAGFWLTDEGTLVFRYVQDLMTALQTFRQQIHDVHDALEGELVVVVAETTLMDRDLKLADAITAFRHVAPNVTVRIETASMDQIFPMLEDRRAQIAIMPVHDRRSDLYYQPLYQETIRLCYHDRHPLRTTTSPITPDMLSAYDTVTVQFETKMGRILSDLGLKRGPMVNSYEGLVAMVKTGLYLGYIAEDYLSACNADNQLHVIPIDGMHYQVDIMGVTLDGAQKKAITSRFLSLMQEQSR